MSLLGAATVLTMMSMMTAVQDNVDERFRGRVMSLVLMTSSLGQAAGSLGGGLVASQIGIRWTVGGMACLLIAFVAVTVGRLDRYRSLDHAGVPPLVPDSSETEAVAAKVPGEFGQPKRPEVFPA
jgi:MFS family permease